jgi:hypothetical protein
MISPRSIYLHLEIEIISHGLTSGEINKAIMTNEMKTQNASVASNILTLESTSTPNSLHGTDNALCPTESPWVNAYGSFDFVSFFVSPDTVLLA